MAKLVRNSWFVLLGFVVGFIAGCWLVKKRQQAPALAAPPPRWIEPPHPAASLRPSAASVEPAAPAEPVEPDDLVQINGIGPSYARALNALGINTFAALAACDPDDLAARIDRLTAARIRRDDWIGQAATLR